MEAYRILQKLLALYFGSYGNPSFTVFLLVKIGGKFKIVIYWPKVSKQPQEFVANQEGRFQIWHFAPVLLFAVSKADTCHGHHFGFLIVTTASLKMTSRCFVESRS